MSEKQNTKKIKADVGITTYNKDGKSRSVITFRDGMDELIEYTYINLVIKKGCLYFERGSADNGGVKLSRTTHNIQSSSQRIQSLLKEFNGEFPLRNDKADEACYVCLLDKITDNIQPKSTQSTSTPNVKTPTEKPVVAVDVNKLYPKTPLVLKNETNQSNVKTDTEEVKPTMNSSSTNQTNDVCKNEDYNRKIITIQTLMTTLNGQIDETNIEAKATSMVLMQLISTL